jgi:hypothetical protein
MEGRICFSRQGGAEVKKYLLSALLSIGLILLLYFVWPEFLKYNWFSVYGEIKELKERVEQLEAK